LQRLKKRADFVAATQSPHVWKRRDFVLQYRPNATDSADARIGFTVTKKQGNAVLRNRVKRRLREVARLHLAELAHSGADYVLIGRKSAATIEFSCLVSDIKEAVRRVHHKAQRE